jgi:hypothetical protein
MTFLKIVNNLQTFSPRMAGQIPYIGLIGMPGRISEPGAEGLGLMQIPPVSVCHQVSTTTHFSLPTILLYQCQASTLMGSPLKEKLTIKILILLN